MWVAKTWFRPSSEDEGRRSGFCIPAAWLTHINFDSFLQLGVLFIYRSLTGLWVLDCKFHTFFVLKIKVSQYKLFVCDPISCPHVGLCVSLCLYVLCVSVCGPCVWSVYRQWQCWMMTRHVTLLRSVRWCVTRNVSSREDSGSLVPTAPHSK